MKYYMIRMMIAKYANRIHFCPRTSIKCININGSFPANVEKWLDHNFHSETVKGSCMPRIHTIQRRRRREEEEEHW